MSARGASDTIAAVATAPGMGGVGIVRVSGALVPQVARALLGALPAPRQAALSAFAGEDGGAIDHGIALYFPAPHSFTGEHVLELQGHGGPVVLDLLLARVLALGARAARPGEFSERAFLNGKLDLAQAEAVADLIEASSAAAARAALNSLSGAFSRRVHELTETLITLRVHIEAALDFPEEEIDFLADPRLVEQAALLQRQLQALQDDAHQGQLLHDGMTVALAGRPNAGKSSLLNALSARDAAIVSPTPGTTRDVLTERIQIDGLPLHVLDTAGLRDATDAVESEGVRRAHAAIARADRVLLVIDDAVESVASLKALRQALPAESRVTVVRNKVDQSHRPPGLCPAAEPEIAVSALDGRGIDALRHHLKECMGYQTASAGTFSARRRHMEALAEARDHIGAAERQLARRQGELAADDLRRAQQALGAITGEFSSDDLLGRIFSSFCIGK